MKRIIYCLFLCVIALSIKAQSLTEAYTFDGNVYATPAMLISGDSPILQTCKYSNGSYTVNVLYNNMSVRKTIVATDLQRIGYKNYNNFECPKDDFYIVQNVFANDGKFEYIANNTVYNEDGVKMLDLPSGTGHCFVYYSGKIYLSVNTNDQTVWYEINKATGVNTAKAATTTTLKVAKVFKDNQVVISDGKGNEYNTSGVQITTE